MPGKGVGTQGEKYLGSLFCLLPLLTFILKWSGGTRNVFKTEQLDGS